MKTFNNQEHPRLVNQLQQKEEPGSSFATVNKGKESVEAFGLG